MCQYCGCHEIVTIGTLMDEHILIRNHCGDTRRCAERGDVAGAVEQVRALQALMRPHNAVEEGGLYLSMTRFEEYEQQAAELYDEHDDLDAAIDAALAAADAGRADQIDWPGLIEVLEVLYEHIQREDNGLFPAAAVILDAEDWERCERLRHQAQST